MAGWRGPLISSLVTSVALLLPRAGLAQGTATLAGAVRAQSGEPLAGGQVSFQPGEATAETSDGGHFQLEVPANAAGVVHFRAVGYHADSMRIPALPPGSTREIGVTLQKLFVLDAITIVARRDRPLLNTEDAATGGAIEQAEIAALPTDQREPYALAYNIPGVAQATAFFGDAPLLSIDGSNALYTQYNLDDLDNNEGFLGGPRVEFPLAGISRLQVQANTYSSHWGRSSNGMVNLESKSGTSDWHGEAFGYYRPGIPFDAAPKITPQGTDPKGFRRFQLGGGGGGAVVRGRTFIYGAAEYTNEDQDQIGSTARTQFVGTEKREKVKLFGRVDQGWSPTQTTTLRFAFSDISRAGAGGGETVPEAAITTKRIGSLTALTHRMTLREGRASNTTSVQVGTFHWYFPPTLSDFNTPQVKIVAPDSSTEAIVGSSNFVFDEKETQLQLRNVFETDLGRGHTLQAGADVITGWFRLTGANTGPKGIYVVVDEGNINPSGTFVSIRDIPDTVRVLSYTIDANPQQVDLTQTLVGVFVEDRWRPSPRLTVTAGLRWDYDDITSRGESSPDLNNFQPRVSFNWLASARSVLRGGLGLYTGKLPYAVYSDAVQFGPEGNANVTFQEGSAFPPPAFGQGPSAADLGSLRDSLPPHEVRRMFALGLRQPFSYQGSLGYAFQLGDNWAVSFDGVWVETRNLPRSFDLNPDLRPLTIADSVNLPADSGDAYRPDSARTGGYRRLTTTESGGRSRYVGLYTAIRHRFSRAFSLDANWTWSRARNNTEDINFNAAHANDYAAEWADAINDRRHKITVRAVYTAAQRLRLSGILDWQTGLPVNRIAGRSNTTYDLDGSGPVYGDGFIGNSDRLFGVPRNGERLPDFFNLSASVAWLVPTRYGSLEVRGDVFNILNGTEWGGFATGQNGSRTQVGHPGDPIVLKSPGPPRQVQFSAKWNW